MATCPSRCTKNHLNSDFLSAFPQFPFIGKMTAMLFLGRNSNAAYFLQVRIHSIHSQKQLQYAQVNATTMGTSWSCWMISGPCETSGMWSCWSCRTCFYWQNQCCHCPFLRQDWKTNWEKFCCVQTPWTKSGQKHCLKLLTNGLLSLSNTKVLAASWPTQHYHITTQGDLQASSTFSSFFSLGFMS